MGFSKVIQLGEVGQLTIAEDSAKVQLSLSVSQQAGQGSVGGFAKASLSAGVELDAHILIDAGLDLAIAKFPAAASILQGAKAAIDAELAKV